MTAQLWERVMRISVNSSLGLATCVAEGMSTDLVARCRALRDGGDPRLLPLRRPRVLCQYNLLSAEIDEDQGPWAGGLGMQDNRQKRHSRGPDHVGG